jgi:hypothetical protein
LLTQPSLLLLELRLSRKQAATHVAERSAQLAFDLFARIWHLWVISPADRTDKPAWR